MENCTTTYPTYSGAEDLVTGAISLSPAGPGTSTCGLSYSSSSNESVQTIGGFTYGEIVISFFLFCIFLLFSLKFLNDWVRGIKIKKHW